MGNFPDFVPDGQGGAVFGFYEVEPWRVHVQWVRADGTMVFEAGGLVAADPAGDEKHVEPALAYNPRTQDIYVFWRLTFDSGPTYRMGLLGQRVTADGGRQWGDGGKALEPVGPTEMTQLETLPVGDGIEVAYVETLGNLDQRIWARRWSAEGESAWASDRLLVSYTQSGISRLTAAWSGSGFTVFGWQDSRGGGGGGDDIYVQNVQPDGTLGPGGGPSFALYLPRLDLRP
jgi:hypothetical protein